MKQTQNLSSVNKIFMKQFGINLIFILFLLSSCTDKYMRAVKLNNKAITSWDTYYTNDSLKIFAEFYGSYNLVHLSDTGYKSSIKILSGVLHKTFNRCKNDACVVLKAESGGYIPGTLKYAWYHTAFVLSDTHFLNKTKWQNLVVDGRTFRASSLKFKNYDVRLIDLQYTFKDNPVVWVNWVNEKENIDSIKGSIDLVLTKIKLGNNYSKIIPPNPFTEASRAFEGDLEEGGNYLSPVLQLKSIEKNYETDEKNSMFAQAFNTYQSFAGVDVRVLSKDQEKIIADLKSKHFLKNNLAKDELINKIAQNQVVMFNEAHVYPNQRYLVSSLLDTMYKLNFRILALEAVAKEPKPNQVYPNLKSGFYIREPQMANLIRHAIALGFRIVSYEDTISNSKGREIMQAENLFNSTLKSNPKEKIIVLGGGSHMEKNSGRWMAYYFKQMSNIDPLTINQTALDYLSFSNDDLIMFEGKDVSNIISGSASFHDIYLINHIKSDKFKINPDAQDYNLKIDLTFDPTKKLQKQLVALVYYEAGFSEPYKLPLYTQLINNTDKQLNLKLPAGTYYIVVKNAIGQTLFKQKYDVPNG